MVIIANQHLVPHNRERIWIRGIRRDMADRVPRTRPFAPSNLACFMIGPRSTVPNILESDFSPKQFKNWLVYRSLITDEITKYPTSGAGHIAVVEIDRTMDDPKFDIDVIPSMRTKGPEFLVVSCEDM